MSFSPRHSRRVAAWSAATALAGLALAGSAFAAPSAPSSVSAPSATNADSVTVTFTNDAVPDVDTTIDHYEVTVGGTTVEAPGGAAATSANVGLGGEGPYPVSVRAVQSDGAVGAEATTSLTVDRTGPTPGAMAASFGGWYRGPSLTITFPNCSDPSGIGSCSAAWTEEGGLFLANTRTVNITDALGNVTPAPVTAAFGLDRTAPGTFGTIAPGDQVSSQPTFSWSRSADGGSGIDRYVVQWQTAADFDDSEWKTLATVGPAASVGDYSAPPSAWSGGPLPEFQPLVWRVVAFDNAGNPRVASPAQGKELLIDPTVPAAPLITSGPNAPTQNTSPIFSWDGNGATFRWFLTRVGSSASIRSGAGTAKEVELGGLTDGAYVFHVTQFTAAARESEEAIRSFVVDTTPPAPPAIVGRPTFPSLGDAIFTWTTEPGAYSRWSVTGRSGNAIVQPTDTPVTQAKLPSLAEDAYTFSVQQVDAAGNVSAATVEPFTVIAPLVVPAPSNGIVTLLPKQNARRLQPKAGKTVFSRTPVLRWTRGPKGTKLFNLQIFRVTVARNSRTPKVTKILSAFPKGRAYRVPKSKTRPKTCYVWRVWPYTGREFTPKPLGVSNYCVASQKVLARKAAVIATRKAAKVAARSRR